MVRILSEADELAVAGETLLEIRRSCVIRPSEARAALINRLGVRLPERFDARETVVNM